MKRDMELIRTILLEIERQPFPAGWYDLSIPSRPEEEISGHVMLLQDAGFIEAINLSSSNGVCWRPKRITHDGYEFLDAARDENNWAEAKAKVLNATGALTLDALKLALRINSEKAMTGRA